MWPVSLTGGGDTCNSDQVLPSTLLGFKCVVFMLSLCAGFFASVMLGWIVPIQLSLLGVLCFTSLSGEGELGPANDEIYVQKTISTTPSGAKPVCRSLPWIRAPCIKILFFRARPGLCQGNVYWGAARHRDVHRESLTISRRTAAGSGNRRNAPVYLSW